jgi:antitoxin YefM
MKSTYTVTEAQASLPRLLKQAAKGDPICIRRRNETVAYVLSRERMEAIVETLEILGNENAMRAIQAHRAGKMKFLALESLDDDE